MARMILLVFLVLGVSALLRRLIPRHRSLDKAEQPRFEATVRCHRCGAYVARRHARADGDVFVCRLHDEASRE